jgi:hypothetical protein
LQEFLAIASQTSASGRAGRCCWAGHLPPSALFVGSAANQEGFIPGIHLACQPSSSRFAASRPYARCNAVISEAVALSIELALTRWF